MEFNFSVPMFLDMTDSNFLEKFDEETPEINRWFYIDDDMHQFKCDNSIKFGKLISK